MFKMDHACQNAIVGNIENNKYRDWQVGASIPSFIRENIDKNKRTLYFPT